MSEKRGYVVAAAVAMVQVLVICIMTSCAGQQTAGEVEVTPEYLESTTRYRREYVLAPGDVIDIVVLQNEEVTRTSLIRPDGYITLPILDDVKAAGLTAAELDAQLTEAFAERLVDPEVSVIATSVREPAVFVLGDVTTPRPVPLRDAATVAQAIAFAGGLNREAASRNVAVLRLNDEGTLQAFTLSPDLSGQPAAYLAMQSTVLQPNDVIFVPESDRSQFVRLLNDYVTTPMGALNQVLTPYFQFRLIEEVSD